MEFLEIDHINGGGCKHREQIEKEEGTKNFYHWLIKHNYPVGYRVLCANCNKAYGSYGYCPHKERRDESWPVSKKENIAEQSSDTPH